MRRIGLQFSEKNDPHVLVFIQLTVTALLIGEIINCEFFSERFRSK